MLFALSLDDIRDPIAQDLDIRAYFCTLAISMVMALIQASNLLCDLLEARFDRFSQRADLLRHRVHRRILLAQVLIDCAQVSVALGLEVVDDHTFALQLPL